MSHSSDERIRPVLLSYHRSGALVATDRLPMTIMTYDPLLQCLIIVYKPSQIHETSHNLGTEKLQYRWHDKSHDNVSIEGWCDYA
jgi:hypothetical protein